MMGGMVFRLAVLSIAFLPILLAAEPVPADPWGPEDLIQPADLAARLNDARAPKPKIYYVGFGVLYRSKHIPAAEFTGPTAKQEELEALRAAVLKLPRGQEIVIYCGCCPWDHCPNIRPAFLMLRELGFKRVKVLALPVSFLKDWIEKGYPVAR
jgi:thiosulfate/3-mercaptopyruvate sulfurtransferase